MTVTAPTAYRWDASTRPRPFDRSKFPPKGVVGEIKPHHRDGIRAGIAQLRTRPGIALPGGRRGTARRTAQLVTYRQVPGHPSRYEVLAADPDELRAAIAGSRSDIRTWYSLGTLESLAAVAPIPRWQCPSMLGAMLEGQIRRRYAARVGARLEGKDSAFRTGADIEHELQEVVDFLRELASELEREASHP